MKQKVKDNLMIFSAIVPILILGIVMFVVVVDDNTSDDIPDYMTTEVRAEQPPPPRQVEQQPSSGGVYMNATTSSDAVLIKMMDNVSFGFKAGVFLLSLILIYNIFRIKSRW